MTQLIDETTWDMDMNPIAHDQFDLSQSDLERLLRCLATADVTGRRAIRSAIRALGGPAVSGLARALACDDVVVRRAAANVLREMPDGDRAISSLASAATDKDWLVRLWAIDALGRLRSAAHNASSALEQALHDPMPLVRNAAFVALLKVKHA